MGFINLVVAQTAPTNNQATTAWFQPAIPSWTAEGVLRLWDPTAGAYAVATPILWGTLLQLIARISSVRVVTASGAFVMTTADAGGAVSLNRQVQIQACRLPLPVGSVSGMTYAIEDVNHNFQAGPVTVNYPAGTTGPGGAADQVLNINGQCAYFRLYPVVHLELQTMIRKAPAFLVVILIWLIAHPALAQFAEQASWAGTGGGTGAAQTITLNNVLTLADILGVNIKWIPSNGNAGATTLNVNGIGAQPVQRVTPAGMAALGGGKLVAGHVAIAMWNGTVFDLQNSAAPDPPGHVMDYAGSSCPIGWAAGNAATVSQTTQAPLYGVLGTILGGSNGGGNFTL